ncbi:MAG: hypothetical protein HONBIEJF_01968 [Fimbriimonadaceae bacterium]|nr:hypothetical protein [Fimbriimonadaceae bacterium]
MFNLLPALILLMLQAPGSPMVEPGQPAWKTIIGAQALADTDGDAFDAEAPVASVSSVVTLLRWCAFIALLGNELAAEQDQPTISEAPQRRCSEPQRGSLEPGFLTPGRTRDGPVLA